MGNDIIAVDVYARLAVLADGAVCAITELFDDDGDECEPDVATAAVVELAQGRWAAIDLGDFVRQALH